MKAMGLGSQRSTQIVQAGAHILEGNLMRAVGPERGGQPGALHRPGMTQDEQGQQPGSLASAEGWKRRILDLYGEGAEQPNIQGDSRLFASREA
jgi:hypothetical protein